MDFALTDEQKLLRRDHRASPARSSTTAYGSATATGVSRASSGRSAARCGSRVCRSPRNTAAAGSTRSTAIALEALGYGCQDGGLVFSLCAHLLSCVVPIWKHGNEEQKRRYLPGLCDGTLIGVNAMTEPDSGSDAFSMRRGPERRRRLAINGTKTFISNGPVADVVIVFAVTEPEKGFHGGVTAFLVEKGAGDSARAEVREDGPAHLAARRAGFRGCARRRRCRARRGGRRRHGVHARRWTGSASACSRPTSGTMERLLESSFEVRAHAQAVRTADRQVPGGQRTRSPT